jgi:peptidoglycan/LPS O-acetylase OafA/YrhL
MGAPVIKDDALARPKASRAALLAGAMLVMSLALSLWSWQIIDKQRQREASARFDLQRERVVGVIENRMQAY